MIGRILSKRYELLDEIGHGGMAVIYSAYDHKEQRTVALKVLREGFAQNDEFLQRFRREGYAMMHIHHPNIVQVYDVCYTDGINYIVMELVPGQTLKELITRTGGLTVEHAVKVAIDLCAALQMAHDNGIIHRDVKPQNVLVSKSGKVKMTDFGIAKVMGSVTIALSGENVLGSVHYIAPEQAQGQDIDERTDVYSLGATLYEMLTGRVPFDADTTVTIALKQIQEEMVPPVELNADIPYSLSACVLKACAKDPDLRYQNPEAMAEDLRRSLRLPEGHFADIPKAVKPEAAPAIVMQSAAPPKAKRNITMMVLGICSLITVLGLLFFMAQTLINNASGTLKAVPNVVGKNSAEAELLLKAEGLLATIEMVYHNSIPEDQVISQNPAGDTMAREKSAIKLIVSAGPEPIVVPKFAGMTLEAAQAAIRESGLRLGQVFRVYDPRVPDGIVISHDPAAESFALSGDEIDLYVSDDSAEGN